MKRLLLYSLFLLLISKMASQAAVIDTVDTYSAAMKKNIKAVVIRPDSYATAAALPVVYLLHGYSGNYADWVKRAEGIQKAADTFQMMIVCPDGGYGSWYWDTKDPQFQYETYVSKELVAFIDGKYKTIKDRTGRAVTGLSMGGHGGLYLAMRHQDVFGAAGSMSGGVDIRPYPNNWDMAKRLGKYAENQQAWEEHTVINMLHLLTPNSLAIMIDCGTEDFFYKVNEKLHEELLYRGIQHDYIVRPGAHNWQYWAGAIQYQLLFMSNYFNRKETSAK